LLFVTIIFELSNLYAGVESEQNIIEWMTAFQMMIAFYFGSKVMHHITSADRSKAVAVAENNATIYAAQTQQTQSTSAVGDESGDFENSEAEG
jgi:hypothetical protein